MVVVYAWTEEPDPQVAALVRGSVQAIGALDPTFVAPWTYGALMCASLGDHEGHELLLREAVALHPDEPWFPAALGMSRYLHADDPAGAARWLEWAANVPGAEPVYGLAAERLRSRSGGSR